VHVLNEDGEPRLKTISFIDTNEVVPKDRYTKGCILALTEESVLVLTSLKDIGIVASTGRSLGALRVALEDPGGILS
jgi:hypothetical protein